MVLCVVFWELLYVAEACPVLGGGQCVHRPPQPPPDSRVVERAHQPSRAAGLQTRLGENGAITFSHCPDKRLWP